MIGNKIGLIVKRMAEKPMTRSPWRTTTTKSVLIPSVKTSISSASRDQWGKKDERVKVWRKLRYNTLPRIVNVSYEKTRIISGLFRRKYWKKNFEVIIIKKKKRKRFPTTIIWKTKKIVKPTFDIEKKNMMIIRRRLTSIIFDWVTRDMFFFLSQLFLFLFTCCNVIGNMLCSPYICPTKVPSLLLGNRSVRDCLEIKETRKSWIV